ncbi:outer membrane receptor protein involved in Fe transport [Winogradskyella epiphytica]|uniref:Outer membrane receptor protein involved in Fe transport n=1 Tax=Winogradskyella epiphytica TaxID=262005 RepID=A0A2V4X0U8_9FLAO|nr:TonB-dependent receptor [Winogradskyella epiphytica]PYE83522.1 outer membrane receptor protein involved in Fe transport [Winogradskyella epiphytica]GGW58770.1 collagen-binding protein [Winogradskyella epiphytica]
MKSLQALFIVFISAFSFAQNTGSVSGKLIDKDFNNEPLPFANVLVKGTATGTTSDMDGHFELQNLEVGSHIIVVSYVGYETKEIVVEVQPNKKVTLNVPLGSSSSTLDEVIIKTKTRKESETALLLDQKKAVEFKQSIGTEELSRKGVSDVATAVTKTTGISKQEGSGNIYVRGLGDRYNSTTMNGLPLPSNNPSRKNISLDLFSTDIVEYISISKTFSPINYGDFAGANIDIISKDYRGNGFFEIDLGISGNSNAISEDNFYLQDGPDKIGFYNPSQPNNPLAAYNFDTSWNTSKHGPINNKIGLKGGDSYTFKNDSRLSFFATASFDNGYKYNEGIARGSVSTQGVARKDFTFDKFAYETNTTALGNLNYKINNTNSLSFNSLFINSSSQSHEEFSGIIDIYDNASEGGGFTRRSTFDKTSIFINQLLGKHDLSEKLDVNWGVSYNMVNNVIPDRMQNTLVPVDNNNINGDLRVSDLATSDNHRFYQDLKEDEIAANIMSSYKFGEVEDETYKGKVTLGYSGRFKNVDFEATQFNFRINRNTTQPVVDRNNLDAYFNQNSLNQGLFTIETFRGPAGTPGVLNPQTYNGNQLIQAAFASLEYKFSPQFTGVFGLRGEYIFQEIEWETSLDPNGDKNDFDTFEILPSASLKYALNDKQNLRFAASKTYTLPQFKERAPFQYEEVTQVFFGNPNLYPSTDYNADLKWELFPNNDEVFSVTAFGKYIQDPINEVTIASATNDISWVNTGESAIALGGEVELRKNLFNLSDDEDLKNKISLGFNASYMHTEQDFDRNKVINETDLSVGFTNDDGNLTGASDLLLNGDISYIKEFSESKNLQATLSYNYFSDRLYAIGTNNKGNLVDKAIGTLDFTFKSNLNKNLSLGLKVRNLLDPTIERVQETQNVIVQSYTKGIDFSFSLTYKL